MFTYQNHFGQAFDCGRASKFVGATEFSQSVCVFIHVPNTTLLCLQAHTMIDCMEKYAFDILRAIMQASEKPDFKEVSY